MNKLSRIPALLAGSALGALLLLGYGLAWQLLSQALGFGVIMFGVSNPNISSLVPWNRPPCWSGAGGIPSALWQQAHILIGQTDALGGAVLGCATMLLVLHRNGSREAKLQACDRCRGVVASVLFCVGFFGALVFLLAVLPGLVTLVQDRDARGFALQEFILTSVVLNPKLWWGAGLLRTANRMPSKTATST